MMHPAARDFVALHATTDPVTVLEAGSRDVNGTVRDLFPNAVWVGVDIDDGVGVSVVADFADYSHDTPVDIVVCTEVLEHTAYWREIIESAYRNLRPGGQLIVTAATHGRTPHSAGDGGPDIRAEWYANIDPDDLETELDLWFSLVQVGTCGTDVQAVAAK